MRIVPVVLAGGVGERFWPLSRNGRPKQLLPIVSRTSMIEETFARTSFFGSRGARPLVVTGKSIAAAIRKALPSRVAYDSIVEPAGKNTAPAVAAAAAWVTKKYGDAVMLVLSSDHSIYPVKEFVASATYAAELAERLESLCVFGIRPSRPETGYGYIQAGRRLGAKGRSAGYAVRRFVEKPDARRAAAYVKSGAYFWNSGMFAWKASVILEEFKSYMPDVYAQACRLAKSPMRQKDVNDFYFACEKESIDYGIMEKSKRVAMVNGAFEWDDVGSWESLERLHPQNKLGTTVKGERVFAMESAQSIVVNESRLAVAACGLKDMVVVATDDAVLVIPRAKLPSIKQYLAAMKDDPSLPRSIF